MLNLPAKGMLSVGKKKEKPVERANWAISDEESQENWTEKIRA